MRTPLYTVELLYSNSLKWGHLCIQWNSSIPTPWNEDTSAHNGIPLLFQPPEMRTLRTFGHVPNSLGHTSADRDTKSQGTDKEYNIYVIGTGKDTLDTTYDKIYLTWNYGNLTTNTWTDQSPLCLLLSEPFIQALLEELQDAVDYMYLWQFWNRNAEETTPGAQAGYSECL